MKEKYTSFLRFSTLIFNICYRKREKISKFRTKKIVAHNKVFILDFKTFEKGLQRFQAEIKKLKDIVWCS